MSAAEKLERLEAKASGPQVYGPEPLEATEVADVLLIVLPEIIAVLKIAEKVDGSHVRRELEDALSALDEKLGDVT